jgi:hypothetical protein
MKTLRVTLQFCFALCLLPLVASVASASTLTLTGNLHFPALDGSAQDSDGLANGTFAVNGDLVLDGTIHCNDVQPLPQSSGACPIKLSVTGDLTLESGSGIFAENRRGEGNGGNVQLTVGGDLTLRGPESSLPGAIVSTSQLLGSGGLAGNLTAEVAGAVDLQAGSVLAANSKSAKAGAIAVTGDTVLVAGLVASGPTRTLLSTPLSGEVLADGSVGQAGGTIHLRALASSEPGLRIESGGIVVSQGEGNGGRLILLEACGIEVRGLVASLSRNNGPSQVVLHSGKGILVDGRDLGSPLPAEGRFGRIRADGTQQGAAGYLVDLFANSDIQILGPEPSSGQGLFAVTSRPGSQPLRNAGGTITAISLSGALTATGNAFEAGRDVQGDKGGVVDLQARSDVTLDGATIWAVGGFTLNLSPNARAGGHIDVRSFQGAVSWTFGVGDVRPTGTGVALARRGTIEITACTTVDITGTQFPVSGSAVAPFPVETEGICSPAAPSLPEGEPALPVCAPANQPPAPSGGPFTIPENSPNGTIVGTVAANDPDVGQSQTFSIPLGNTGDAFAIDSAGQITVADSTKLDFETTPSFTLTVQATDNGTPSQSGTGTVIVNLADVNDPPKPSGGPFTIPENSPNGTSVGTVAANDQDAGQTHTFNITNGNVNGAFAIGLTTGQITVADSAALNYEAIISFSLTVEVMDSGSLTASTTVTVDLLNVPEAPVAVDEGTAANPYVETVGNTLLKVTATPGAPGEARIVFSGNVLTNDFDPDGPETFTATLESATAGAIVTVNPDGTFTYVPPPGFTGVDSFTYRATGSDSQSDTATVYINVEHRVWYVRNDAAADGLGRSVDPFDTLAEAESASQAGDTIYLFAGNGATTGQSDGIVLKSGQRLIGEAVQLAAPAAVNINGVDGPTLRQTTGNKPKIENDNAPDAPGEDNGVSVPAITESATGVEIRGLEISGFDNGIDVTVMGANDASVAIWDNTIMSVALEGIDVNAEGTGTVTLAIQGNTLWTTGNAIDIQRTNGFAYITAFANNAISGDSAGTGINIVGVIFDSVPGGLFDPVSGGTTVIGASGNGVGQSGLVLTNVQGRLSFTDLDVFADGGAGLRASSSTPYTGSAGLQLVVSNPGVATLEATGGPATDISQASISLPLASIKSTDSSTTGVALNGVVGTFSAEPASSVSNITSPSGTAFQVGGSNATITYEGTINTTQGKGVDLNGNTGSTISFSGGMALSTGALTAFSAVGGGTVNVTDPPGLDNNTITTTTGTAVNITNTVVGGNGVTFESVTSTASGASTTIVLSNTGNGPFLVTGTGASGTGGTISNKTVDAVTMNNTDGTVTLRNMIIQDIGDLGGGLNTVSGDDAIHAQQVDGGLILENVIIRRISDQAIHGALLAGGATVWNGLAITNSIIEDANRFNVANVGDANNEGMIRIVGIRGNVSITGSTLQRGGELVDFFVTDGTLNMNASTNNFRTAYKEFTAGTTASVGGHCIDVTVQGTANANVTIGDRSDSGLANSFLNCRLGSVRVANDSGATGSVDVVIGRNIFAVNDHSSGIGGDFDFPQGGVLVMSRGTDAASFDVVIDGNYFDEITNASGGVGQVSYDMQNGNWQVLMEDNTFDTPGNAPWFLRADSTAAAKVLFRNNLGIKGFFTCPDASCAGGYDGPGLRALADVQNGGVLDLTVIGDQFAEHDASFDPGQTFEARVLNTGGGGTLCLDLQNNQAPDGYSLEEFAGDLNLVGSGSCPVGSPSAGCQTLLGAKGNLGGSNVSTTSPPFVNVAGTIDIVVAACQQPTGGIF